MSKRISLTQGKFAIVDDGDYEFLNQFKWYHALGYARRDITDNGKSKNIWMHREVLGVEEGKFTDHINGDGLDNRRANLRSCTHTENMRNAKPHGKTSKYKGVYWYKKRSKWVSKICVDRKQIYLGNFDLEKEAAESYDCAAKHYFREFAYLNFG